MDTAFLSFENIVYNIGGKTILDGVSLRLDANSITTIIGPNGAGKTTLVKLIAGLLSPTSGVIHRQGGLKIAYVPQKIRFSELFPLRVIDFLRLF